MGQTRALYCDEESCNRLGAFGYVGHWIEVRASDLDFCSVECALDYTRGLFADAENVAHIEAAVAERASFNPDARAAAAAWRREHPEEVQG